MRTTLQTPCETGLTRESVLKANCAHATQTKTSQPAGTSPEEHTSIGC